MKKKQLEEEEENKGKIKEGSDDKNFKILMK